MDATSLMVFWQKHKHQTGLAITALLIFAAGWQSGRITSPYYAAHPIIFKEGPTPPGGGGELEALQAEGVGLRDKAANVEPTSPTSSPKLPTIAGETTANKTGQFVGSINSDLYHHVDCPTSSRILEKNQIWFADEADASAAGYKPSKCTIDQVGVGEE